MTFRVRIETCAVRDLRKLDRATAERILKRLADVAHRGYGFEPLTNFDYGWKVRIGDYRALCDIDFDAGVISVYVVAHRREVYKGR